MQGSYALAESLLELFTNWRLLGMRNPGSPPEDKGSY